MRGRQVTKQKRAVMARIGFTPALIAIVAGLGLVALGLTTYTFPIEGAASDPTLYNLIAGALHDAPLNRGPRLGASPLPVIPASPTDSGSAPNPPTASVAEPRDDPRAWAEAAAQADSGALRDWLGRWVLATARTSHDTIRLTLRRWSHRPGCPALSTLVATTTGVARGVYRLSGITATCPSLPEAGPP
jgi:hypothetical protein